MSRRPPGRQPERRVQRSGGQPQSYPSASVRTVKKCNKRVRLLAASCPSPPERAECREARRSGRARPGKKGLACPWYASACLAASRKSGDHGSIASVTRKVKTLIACLTRVPHMSSLLLLPWNGSWHFCDKMAQSTFGKNGLQQTLESGNYVAKTELQRRSESLVVHTCKSLSRCDNELQHEESQNLQRL